MVISGEETKVYVPYSNYSMVSTIECDKGLMWAGTAVYADNILPGYVGIQERLYDTNNKMVASSPMDYNTDRTTVWGLSYGYSLTVGKAYYSQSIVRIWNAEKSFYETYECKRTPLATLFSNFELIEVIDKNGKEGYVKSTDVLNVNDLPQNPEQAIEHMKKDQISTIDLLDKDCNMIGKFELSGETR